MRRRTSPAPSATTSPGAACSREAQVRAVPSRASGGVALSLRHGRGYRGGAWHTATSLNSASREDAVTNDFGVLDAGGFTVELVSNASRRSASTRSARRCDTRYASSSSSPFYDDKLPPTLLQETTHVRQAVVKRAVQKMNTLVLELADVDRSALEKVSFRDLHRRGLARDLLRTMGRRVPQGVGTVLRVPLTWVKKTGGLHKFAGPKVLGTPGALLAVYRGDSAGPRRGRAGSRVLGGNVGGHRHAGAVRGDRGIRAGADRFQRPALRPRGGLSPAGQPPRRGAQANPGALRDHGRCSIPFAEAAAYDNANGFLVDCLHGGDTDGRTGVSIVEDLLFDRALVAHADRTQAVGDHPGPARLPALALSTGADQCALRVRRRRDRQDGQPQLSAAAIERRGLRRHAFAHDGGRLWREGDEEPLSFATTAWPIACSRITRSG
jgi:hypothetical protein